MDLILKALAGALIVVFIQLLTSSRNYYIAGMIPLFPTFALISHYLVGSQRTLVELKETIIFSMLSLLPYFVYLLALYFLVDRLPLIPSLLGATLFWILVAVLLIALWNRIYLS